MLALMAKKAAKPGRPPVKRGEPSTTRNVRLPTSADDKLTKLADKWGVTPGRLARHLILLGIKGNPPKPDFSATER